MKLFLKFLKWIGILLLVMIIFSWGSIWLQVRDAKELCTSYQSGDQMPSIEALDDEYLLHPMGPFDVESMPGYQDVIFCASATMCETACRIRFKDNEIIEIKPR